MDLIPLLKYSFYCFSGMVFIVMVGSFVLYSVQKKQISPELIPQSTQETGQSESTELIEYGHSFVFIQNSETAQENEWYQQEIPASENRRGKTRFTILNTLSPYQTEKKDRIHFK